MNIDIKVCTSNTCEVIIKDITPTSGESGYLPESFTGVATGRFRRSDTVTIDMLILNKTEGQEIQTPRFNTENKVINIPVKFDGWFNVCRVVLPSKEWFERELNKETGSAIQSYDIVYYSDGKDLYKYIDGNSQAATIEEITDRNTEGTTISRVFKNYVSICFLKKCYLSLCQQIFNSRGFSKCWNRSQIESDLVFRRDLVWTAINVIKYRVEFNQLAEAQRVIEQIGGCNGLCKSEFRQTSNHGCGCTKE